MNATAKLTSIFVAIDAGLLALSGIFKDSHGVKGVLGGIGWFGFLLVTLGLVVFAVIQVARRARGRVSA